MKTYRVTWTSQDTHWNYVKAETKEEAVQKAKDGEFCGDGDDDEGEAEDYTAEEVGISF